MPSSDSGDSDHDEVWNVYTHQRNSDGAGDASKAAASPVGGRGSTSGAAAATSGQVRHSGRLSGERRSSLDVPHQGEINRASGAIYNGQIKRGVAHGTGRQTWPSGAAYDGEWIEDTMHGQGTLTTPDGSRYEGRWADSRQHGEGIYTAPDGGRYEGLWEAGKMHGEGVYTWPDGAIFEGEFSRGERSGFGLLKYANGSKYEGEWLNSKQHGTGHFTTIDGRVREGIWNEGQRTRWVGDGGEVGSSFMNPVSTFGFEIEATRLPQTNRCSDRCNRIKSCAVL